MYAQHDSPGGSTLRGQRTFPPENMRKGTIVLFTSKRANERMSKKIIVKFFGCGITVIR